MKHRRHEREKSSRQKILPDLNTNNRIKVQNMVYIKKIMNFLHKFGTRGYFVCLLITLYDPVNIFSVLPGRFPKYKY